MKLNELIEDLKWLQAKVDNDHDPEVHMVWASDDIFVVDDVHITVSRNPSDSVVYLTAGGTP